MKESDLLYGHEYVNHARSAGDNPNLIISDSKRFSRNEKYEVLYFLNVLHGKDNADLTIRTRQICEWMIHEYLPNDIQSTLAVKNWVGTNYSSLSPSFPF